MKKLFVNFSLMFWIGATMANGSDSDLIKRIQSLNDLTGQITAHDMPSILLNSPEDRRINKFADSQLQPFIVQSEGSQSFVVVVNPKKQHGFLWWKKSARIVFTKARWLELLNGRESLLPQERIFIQEL